MIINWGTGIVNLRDNIVIQYNYFGVFWIFYLSYGLKYYEVTGEENTIVRELTAAETGVANPEAQIPLMTRFGLLFFIALVIILHICIT